MDRMRMFRSMNRALRPTQTNKPGRHDPDRGPKWNACTEFERRFIDNLVVCFNRAEAYRRAGGFDPDAGKNSADRGPGSNLGSSAWRVFHRPRVQEALREAMRGRSAGDVPEAYRQLLSMSKGFMIVDNGEGKPERMEPIPAGEILKATKLVIAMGGMGPVERHEHVIEVVDSRQRAAAIKQFAETHGLDPSALLGDEEDITDAEYEEIPNDDPVDAGGADTAEPGRGAAVGNDPDRSDHHAGPARLQAPDALTELNASQWLNEIL